MKSISTWVVIDLFYFILFDTVDLFQLLRWEVLIDVASYKPIIFDSISFSLSHINMLCVTLAPFYKETVTTIFFRIIFLSFILSFSPPTPLCSCFKPRLLFFAFLLFLLLLNYHPHWESIGRSSERSLNSHSKVALPLVSLVYYLLSPHISFFRNKNEKTSIGVKSHGNSATS